MNKGNKNLLIVISDLDIWIEANGWAGYDPYDIKEMKSVLKITRLGNQNKIMEIFREIVFEIFYTFPIISRKVLSIKPKLNAKAMGLFAAGYLDLYIATADKKYLQKSKYCIQWLENNSSKIDKGIGWGYPFAWQSDVYVPKFTPNGIVTTAAGDAFWSWYKYTNEKKYLDLCKSIGEFLITLPVDSISKEQVCFAYTPLSKNHIHNLNLFVAEYLIKVGKEINKESWIDIGLKAVNYTIKNQNKNGTFDYNGPPDKLKNFSDNYHTGFVLRMLHSIWKLTQKNDIYNSMERCYTHYINNFFEDKKIPKLLPNRKYRIDIHSCAESINCFSQLSETFPDGVKIAENVINWTINNLYDREGYFYYGIFKSRFTKTTFKSKIAYLRWGQAWMLKGLSNYILRTKN